ncbi:MAG TPA: hypothetical protein QGH10_05715 [Armatimonadota bacterium]|jgi:GH18 family chitinase|nr:hypothetical protein [Armatimonadota bacterium]
MPRNSSAYAIEYASLPSLLGQGWTREADEESRVSWFWSPDRTTFTSMDDPQSMAEKSKWASGRGLPGDHVLAGRTRQDGR